MSVSVFAEAESPAVTVRPSAETMPWVTVGVPAASPRALPMATTASPTWALFELPNVMVGRFEAPVTFKRATSLAGSVPTRVAAWAFVVPDSVTVMVPLPPASRAMTWLLVMTMPSEEMIMPVPWSSEPWDFTSIETTAGRTFCTRDGMVTLPLKVAAPGEALLSWITVEVGDPLLNRAVTPAPTAPPMRAATAAIASQPRPRRSLGADGLGGL